MGIWGSCCWKRQEMRVRIWLPSGVDFSSPFNTFSSQIFSAGYLKVHHLKQDLFKPTGVRRAYLVELTPIDIQSPPTHRVYVCVCTRAHACSHIWSVLCLCVCVSARRWPFLPGGHFPSSLSPLDPRGIEKRFLSVSGKEVPHSDWTQTTHFHSFSRLLSDPSWFLFTMQFLWSTFSPLRDPLSIKHLEEILSSRLLFVSPNLLLISQRAIIL